MHAIVMILALQTWSLTVPDELSDFQAHREAIPKAKFLISYTTTDPDLPKRRAKEHIQWDKDGNYLRRILKEELDKSQSNDPGLPGNTPANPFRNTFVRSSGELWNSAGDAIRATKYGGARAKKHRAADLRMADFTPYLGLYDDIENAVWAPFVIQGNPTPVDRVEYAVEDEGSLRKVTTRMISEYGEIRIVRLLDPKRGMGCVRAQHLVNGELRMESRTRLVETDAGWFPKQIRYFRNGRQSSIIEVESAEFGDSVPDKMDYAKELNLDVGTQVSVYQDSDAGPSGLFVWGKGKLVTVEEFEASGMKDGKRRLAGLEKIRRENLIRLVPAEKLFWFWDRSVNWTIKNYGFDDQQTQKALLMLEECKDIARTTLLAPGVSDYELLQKALREESLADELDEKKVAEIEEKLNKIRVEVYKILRNVLEPRVKKLATRAQVEAYEKAKAESRKKEQAAKAGP